MKTKRCESPKCGAEMVFLKNQKSGKMVPIDVESLSVGDLKSLDLNSEVEYDKDRHVSHFRSCKDVQRFAK